jgi:hypothetical protein
MILRNVSLYYARLNKPNSKHSPENPTWECQIRTENKEQKNEWIEAGLRVKAEVPDEGAPYWRVNLRKRSIKKDGAKASPPEVVGADLMPINPEIIGNGSIGNVQIFQYEYNSAMGKGIASILMGVQVTKLIEFISSPRESFTDEGETEVVSAD